MPANYSDGFWDGMWDGVRCVVLAFVLAVPYVAIPPMFIGLVALKARVYELEVRVREMANIPLESEGDAK